MLKWGDERAPDEQMRDDEMIDNEISRMSLEGQMDCKWMDWRTEAMIKLGQNES